MNEEIQQILRQLADLKRDVDALKTKQIYQTDISPGAVKQRHVEAKIVFVGDASDRPDGTTNVKAYFAKDTGVLSLWSADDEVWVDFPRIPASVNAYTQTYSTADRTHAAPTGATLSMADGAGTNDNTIGAITADASVIAAFQEVVDEVNKIIADVADIKQIGNALIDDLQSAGIVD